MLVQNKLVPQSDLVKPLIRKNSRKVEHFRLFYQKVEVGHFSAYFFNKLEFKFILRFRAHSDELQRFEVKNKKIYRFYAWNWAVTWVMQFLDDTI